MLPRARNASEASISSDLARARACESEARARASSRSGRFRQNVADFEEIRSKLIENAGKWAKMDRKCLILGQNWAIFEEIWPKLGRKLIFFSGPKASKSMKNQFLFRPKFNFQAENEISGPKWKFLFRPRNFFFDPKMNFLDENGNFFFDRK